MSDGEGYAKDNSGDFPDDLAKFRDSYVELFGSLPALPAARFAFSGEIDPQALRLIEQLRACVLFGCHRRQDHEPHSVRHASG